MSIVRLAGLDRAELAYNLLFAAGAFGVGAIINLWPVVDGRYALDAYRTAFGLCWLLQVAAVALAYAERSGLTAARPR